MENPDTNYFIIVPEQFTMATQRKIVGMHPNHGIMNVDILSFPRLAYRIFEEVGVKQHEILDDTGKSLVLRKVIEEHKSELRYFARNIGKAGFVEEMKSVISELLQYSVSAEDLLRLQNDLTDNPILKYKLSDIEVLYKGFHDFIQDKYIASEELLEVLCGVIKKSQMINNSVVVLDGFTGFTPIQYRLIEILLELCSKVTVTIQIDSAEKLNVMDGMENLFHLSKTTAAHLNYLADRTRTQMLPAVVMEDAVPYRLNKAPELAFLEKNIFRSGRNVYTGTQEGRLRIYEGTNPKNEIDYAAGEIKRLITEQNYHFGDFAVVTADMENYGYLAGNIMEQNDIPCFVDYKRNIMGNVIVECIRSAMEVVEKDFSYESVFRFLKTGISGLKEDEIDQLENYVLALGIRGFSRWNKKWIRTYASRHEMTITIERLDELREQVVELLEEFRTNLRSSATVREYCTAVYQFMVRLKLSERAGEYTKWFEEQQDIGMSGEYRQCYGKIIGLLDRMVTLLGEEKLGFSEFVDILDAGFGEIKVGLIPQKKDSVIIGDIERTRLDNVKVLFFLGVNDGNIPKNGGRGGVLSSVDREIMAQKNIVLSPDERENAFIQRFYLYLVLTKASDRIYLSYSRLGADGKALRVSYLIGQLRAMFPHVCIDSAKTAAAVLRTVRIPKSLLRWNGVTNVPISPEHAKQLYGQELSQSASRIEQFYQCVFAHFVSYGLRLEERAIYDVNSADIGTLFHDTLERVSEKIQKDGSGFTEITAQRRRELVEEAVLEAATDYKNLVLFDSERNRYFVKRLTDMTDMTVWAIGEQLKHGRFVPHYFEQPFHTAEHIVGRIDRIDTYEDNENVYLKIVDYKTGNSDFDLNDAYYGMKLQLITYMQAAEQMEQKLHPDKKICTAGVFYYNIKTPFAEDDSDQDTIDRQLLEELRMKGLVSSAKEALAALENEPEGKSVAIPATFQKDGSVKESADVLTQDQMKLLSAHARKMILRARKDMEEGSTELNPYKKDGKTACDYCPYGAVCGFDPKIGGYTYHNIHTCSDEEIWEKLGEENREQVD
jgi:ATP-dependent helicase/nuclease subunit B